MVIRTPKWLFQTCLLLNVLLLIVILQSTVSCDSSADSSKEIVIPIKLSEVKKEDISVPIYTSGKLYSKHEIKLSFKNGGLIESIIAEEGQSYPGDTLLSHLDLSEIKPQLEHAQSEYEQARNHLRRIENLRKENVATPTDLDRAKSAFAAAEAQRNIAQFNLETSSIFAPSEGRILKRLAEEGEMISPGVPVFLFASNSEDWIMRVSITDRDIVKLKMNDKANITFDSYPNQTFSAYVSEIAVKSDEYTGTYEVELTLFDANENLFSGFIGKAEIIPRDKEEFHIIPIEALVEGHGYQGYVYILNHDSMTVDKIPITIAHILNESLAVKSGLENIDKIVSAGAEYLSSGAKVEIIE